MSEEPFSLLSRAWIPVQRADGSRADIRPAEITSEIDSNPVIAPAWGRPDFDAATHEFWIGLLAVACAAQAFRSEWKTWFLHPPSPKELDAAFASLAPAFVLDGDGPRFGQVADDGKMREEQPVVIADLWMDSQSSYFNKDRENLVLSRAGAAISLFTLQTYAPEGGRGHFTSVRGGGPLTTLVVPTERNSEGDKTALWRTLWLNVPASNDAAIGVDRMARIFPWLDPPAEGEGQYDPNRGDELQALWGLPRRIVLDMEANANGTPCSITGIIDNAIVRTFRRRPSGIQYAGNLTHPLSPARRSKASEPFRAFRAPPGGVGYRHWVGLVVPSGADAATEVTRPAKATIAALDRARKTDIGVRLRASGYETKQNKALGFVESELPVHGVRSDAAQSYEGAVCRLVEGAKEVEGRLLRTFVRNALFVKRTRDNPGFQKAVSNGGALNLVRDRFWDRTAVSFTQIIAKLAHEMEPEDADIQKLTNDAAEDWRTLLQRVALAIFDELVPLTDLDALDARSARARIEARSDLHFALLGYGKLGAGFLKALDLAPPEQHKKTSKRAKRAKEADA